MSKVVRRFGIVGLVMLASLLLSVGVAAAQGNGPGGPGGQGPGNADANDSCAGEFVDEDGDGVCDLAGTGQANAPRMGNAQGAGAAGGMAQGNGPGAANANSGCVGEFVDEDGDGVCDLAGTGQANAPRMGNTQDAGAAGPVAQGNGPGAGNADSGCVGDFVDEDGDGVCDLAGTGQANAPRTGNAQGAGAAGGMVQGNGPGAGNADSDCAGEFVDEDGDGVCDLAGTGQASGPGVQPGTQTKQAVGQAQQQPQGFLARTWAKFKGWKLWRAGQ